MRLSLPGLPVAGSAEPIRLNIDFETGVVDQIIEWLTMVRALRPANNQPAATLDLPPCRSMYVSLSRRPATPDHHAP